MNENKKEIRLGVFGLNRGSGFLPAMKMFNVKVVCVLEKRQDLIDKYREKIGHDFYVCKDFDDMLNQDIDSILLANYFPDHAKYAIKALDANKNVLSECQSNVTMAQGVALCRAQERSKAKYMLLENYPYMIFNQEMKKVFEEGTLGAPLYAEGEYNHPGVYDENLLRTLVPFEKHWRRFLPSSYYLTHALAPLCFITGKMPVRICALPIFSPYETNGGLLSGDRACCMTTINEDNSVYRFFGCSTFGYKENSYRVCCEKGQVENPRGENGKIRVSYNDWEIPEGKELTQLYEPTLLNELPKEEIEVAKTMGHSFGDFFVMKKFAEVVRGESENIFDVYFATRLSSCAILGLRSMQAKGMPFDIPDFRNECDKKKYENDNITPFYSEDGEPNISPCSRQDFKLPEDALERFRELTK